MAVMRPRSTNPRRRLERTGATRRIASTIAELFLDPSLSLSVSIGDNSKSQPTATAQTATRTGATVVVPPTVEAGGSGD